jgi:hypothetical protein
MTTGTREAIPAMNRACAVAPVVMSTLAFLLAFFGGITAVGRAEDEGTSAHVFQLLIVAQVPFVVGFLATADWRRARRVAFTTALHVAAVVLAFAPILYFQL